MAAQRIEVKAKKLANGKLEVTATDEAGKVLLKKTCKEPGSARETFGLTHGQNAHPIYIAAFGSNYYLADMIDDGEQPVAVGMPRGRAKKRRR